MADKLVRLQKFMADNGIASRRKSEELIERGSVKVNGRVAHIGDKVDPKHDKVQVNGRNIVAVKKKVYIMLHKPRGYITTMSDEMDRKCVAELVKDVDARIYPVGRLDRDSEGLLFLTNDGAFANAMMHPSKHIPKTYRVTVRPDINDDQLTKLATGVMVDGRMTAEAQVSVITKEPGRVVLQMTIHEGRNREIRKMCEAVGLEVARLKRTSIGSVKLGMLPQGKYRNLTDDEVHKLLTSTQKSRDLKND